MPVYAFKGFDKVGKSISGSRESDSTRNLRIQLRKEGIVVNFVEESKISEGGTKSSSTIKKQSVSSQELAMTTRQLATLIGASIPLVDALNGLVDQVEHPYLRSVLSQIKQRVNEGSSLGDAMADHPSIFSPLFVNMIRAGESSGALDVVLNRLADFTENASKLQQKFIGAMFYPIIMLMMAVGVVGLMMTVVVPKIVKMFEDQKVALPLPTTILIGFSNFLQHYGWLAAIVLVLLGLWFNRYRKSDKGSKKLDRLVLQLPIFGSLIRMLAVARFSRTLATLLESGVPLLAALDIVKNIVTNDVLTQAIDSAKHAISEGESIAAPLKRSGQFPPIVTHMVAIGEKSGQLEAMLAKIADAYESQAESRIMGLTSIMEPILIIVMGVVVAFIVFAIMLPMLQMSSFAGK